MSWSDILYPGNPARREKVVRLRQELNNCIELNFDTTNELIKALNTHCHCELHPVKMNRNGTVRENCDVLLAAIQSIQDTLQAIDARLKSELEPDLYRKLHNFEETDAKKMEILRSVATAVSGLPGTRALVFIIKLVLSNELTRILSQMITFMVTVGAFMFGALAAVLLGTGANLIFSIFLGTRERNKLEEEIRELEKLVDEFKPASKQYNKIIMKVTCMLPSPEENQPLR